MDRIRKFYNHLAPIYDPLLSAIFASVGFEEDRYRTKMIRNLSGAYSDLPVLDLGCGTGRNFFLINKLLGNRKIVAIDISDKMLYFAKKRAIKNGITNIEYVQNDLANWKEIQSIIRGEYLAISSLTLSVIWKKKDAVNGFLSLCRDATKYSIMDGYWGVGIIPIKGQLTKAFSMPFKIDNSYWSVKTERHIAKFLKIRPSILFNGMIFIT